MCVSQDPWAAVDATYLSSPSPPNADDRSSVIVTVPAPLENNVTNDTELPAAPASPAASVKTTLTEAVEQEMDKLGVGPPTSPGVTTQDVHQEKLSSPKHEKLEPSASAIPEVPEVAPTLIDPPSLGASCSADADTVAESWPPHPENSKADLRRWTQPVGSFGFHRAVPKDTKPVAPMIQKSLSQLFKTPTDAPAVGEPHHQEKVSVSAPVDETFISSEPATEHVKLPEPGIQQSVTADGVSSCDEEHGLPKSFKVTPPTVRNRKMVASLAESYLLEDDCFHELLDTDGEDKILDILQAMQEDSLSTAFSGVEAAGSATNCLRNTWSKNLGVPLGTIKPLSQIEWNQACVKELLPSAKTHGACVFQNIMQFFRPELKPVLEQCLARPDLAVEILGPIISQMTSVTREGWCLTHGRTCTLKAARRHCAGTSCKPYSKKGSQLGQVDPEIVFTLAWIALRLELQEPVVLSENVKTTGQRGLVSALDSSDSSGSGSVCDAGLGNLLLRFLAPFYHMECVVLDPTFYGFPMSREREFILMIHKQKCIGQKICHCPAFRIFALI